MCVCTVSQKLYILQMIRFLSIAHHESVITLNVRLQCDNQPQNTARARATRASLS